MRCEQAPILIRKFHLHPYRCEKGIHFAVFSLGFLFHLITYIAVWKLHCFHVNRRAFPSARYTPLSFVVYYHFIIEPSAFLVLKTDKNVNLFILISVNTSIL